MVVSHMLAADVYVPFALSSVFAGVTVTLGFGLVARVVLYPPKASPMFLSLVFRARRLVATDFFS